jgi:hypothetical protein
MEDFGNLQDSEKFSYSIRATNALKKISAGSGSVLRNADPDSGGQKLAKKKKKVRKLNVSKCCMFSFEG